MPVTFQLTDLTPKFLHFYELARDADPERRWELWNQHYRFAAIPPTDEGMAMARRMLDESFHRYPEAEGAIRAGAGGFRPEPQAVMDAVCRLLEFVDSMTVRLIIYVGNFEKNAFAYTMDGVPVVNLPIEESEHWRALTMPHEFTHVVHGRLSNTKGGWLRSIGYSMMMEGLAMQAAMQVTPGFPEAEYHELRPGWLAECQTRERAILEGIRPFLAESSNEALSRFIFGTGSTGLERELYYAGYRAIGHLLARGRTFGQLARIDEEAAPAFFDGVLAEMLTQ